MADDSFEFNITKFLAEQKHLLAQERERFTVEKNNILEPENVPSPKVNSPDVASKRSKDVSNAKLVQCGVQSNQSSFSAVSEKENRSSFGNVAPEEQECPVEKILRMNSGKNVQYVHSEHFGASPGVTEKKVNLIGGNRDDALPDREALLTLGVDQPMQQDEMEQWVSDTFYSYFPSFNKNQNDKKSMLSQARQADYQDYLKNIPQVTTKHQQYMEKYGNQAVQAVNEKGTNTSKPGGNTKSYLSPNSLSPNVSQHHHPHQQAIPSIRKTMASDTHPAVAANSYMRKGSPREKLIEDLTHTDLSTIINTDTIDRRNRMLAEEESRRKLEYQRELIKQIEEKRNEVERLREKEKLEEEMLTSRLEQQLKTMQLEEELEREKKRSEKIRLANEQNHIRRLQLLSKLENDHKLFNPYDDQRKTLSENGKEVYIEPAQQKPTKEKVYRYFSNSAQNEKASSFTSTSISSEVDYDSSSESMNYDRYQYCKNCRTDIDRSFLPRGHNPGHQHHHHPHQHNVTPKSQRKGDEHCLNCRKRIEKLCTKCDRVMKRSMNRSLCTICQQAAENSRMQKEAQSELKRQRSKLIRSMQMLDDEDDPPLMEVENPPPPISSSPPNPYKIIDIQYHESDNDHDLAVLNPVIVRNNYKKPFSLNIEKDSLFHPSKKTPEPKVSVNIRNGEVFVDNKLGSLGTPKPPPEDTDDITTDEMDDRISKYVKHYNTLWMKRSARKNNLISQKNANVMNGSSTGMTMMGSKLGPLPSLSPPNVYVSDRADNLKSDAMKTTEKKWDIPAVERTKMTPGSPRVLTQLGAIRKQLQLEQMQMDQTYTKNQ